ncbi:MAG: hypothetical protein A2287_05380 [Candidatus Melainabacteria bacterium RIFOXYA12_FULL_32_12]|nr:MAG: hypothetical protein A2255_07465 [Candidatus Melainabacteria bacterium RIFOXYA2_FULL_32_9]OGI29231.1 MAG: hypothetical protein A2287_05380 [Candidatus Melainabacteria bacterium RIFOXYA12_FULL_32_12]
MERLKKNIKKTLIIFFTLNLLLAQGNFSFAQSIENSSKSLQGTIEKTEDKEEKKLFTGEKQELEKGTQLKMTVSQVISSGYSEEGDEFFAEVTNDLNAPGGILIPAGTIAHGKVSKLRGTKRLGRDAYITVNFDYLVTPDGREIPIEASMTTKRHPVTSAAKVVLEDTAYTMAGGVIGGFLALKFLGLGAAMASHGYTVAGGAGVGALVGVTASLARKGDEALIAPGDEINVHVASQIELPIMSEEALKDEEKQMEGLDVKITEYMIEKDPFGEPNTITLTLNVDNKTRRTFSSFDMALVNDYNSVYYPSPFGNTDLWFHKITPNTKMTGKLSFAVDNPKRKHWLVFYDTTSRKVLAKISIKNAERMLKKEKNKKS